MIKIIYEPQVSPKKGLFWKYSFNQRDLTISLYKKNFDSDGNYTDSEFLASDTLSLGTLNPNEVIYAEDISTKLEFCPVAMVECDNNNDLQIILITWHDADEIADRRVETINEV